MVILLIIFLLHIDITFINQCRQQKSALLDWCREPPLNLHPCCSLFLSTPCIYGKKARPDFVKMNDQTHEIASEKNVLQY